MNPRTRQALGLFYTALMAVYNTCFFSVALSCGQWIGTGVVAALSLGLIAQAAIRPKTPGKIHWAPVCGVLCGLGKPSAQNRDAACGLYPGRRTDGSRRARCISDAQPESYGIGIEY